MLRIIMWYKSYVPIVVDPLSGHQAMGTATRPWTRPLALTQQDFSTNIELQQHVG